MALLELKGYSTQNWKYFEAHQVVTGLTLTLIVFFVNGNWNLVTNILQKNLLLCSTEEEKMTFIT